MDIQHACRYQCITNALPVRYQCVTCALPVYYQSDSVLTSPWCAVDGQPGLPSGSGGDQASRQVAQGAGSPQGGHTAESQCKVQNIGHLPLTKF